MMGLIAAAENAVPNRHYYFLNGAVLTYQNGD